MSSITDRTNLDFLLREVFDLAGLLKHPRYAAYDAAAVSQVLDLAQQLAESEFLPYAAAADADEPKLLQGRVVTPEPTARALSAYAAAGLFGAGFDEADGGLQLPWMLTLAVNGMFQAANLPVANYAMLTTANAAVIAAFGTPAQRRAYVPPMIAGRWFGTMCLSEPQAGSSLSDIRTLAEPAPELGERCFRLRGAKMWISGGDHEISENIVHLVLARTPDAPPGVKGLSLFIVPKRRLNAEGGPAEMNDVSVGGLNHKMGQRGTSNCLLNFGDEGACVGELLGERHQGLACMFHMMNEARIGVGFSSVMSALAGYLYALDYAKTRLQGRRLTDKGPASPPVAIIEHADVKRMLLAQKAAVEGALALGLYCARLVDEQKIAAEPEARRAARARLELLTPIMKSWPSEHCLEANKLAIQVLGGYGYTRDYPVERLYRDNRLNHIHEGAWGIQALDLLGRKVRDAAALESLLGEIRDLVGEAAADPELAADAQGLARAVEALARATAAALGCEDPERATANATLYLDAFGQVVVGWMWLKQALAARRADTAAVDSDFRTGKITAYRYFMRYELPKVDALLRPVESLDATCLEMRPEAFAGA
jgi:butyryl-CoA dehydrogenase